MSSLLKISSSMQMYTAVGLQGSAVITKYSFSPSNVRLYSCKMYELQRHHCRRENVWINPKVFSKFNSNGLHSLRTSIFEAVGLRVLPSRSFCSAVKREESLKTLHKDGCTTIPAIGASLSGHGKSPTKSQPASPQKPKPPPQTKKTRAPKIDKALVEELRKTDEVFAQTRSALQAIFPFPKNNLHNAFAIISSQLSAKHSVEFVYDHVSQAPACWQCTVKVAWPREAQFTSRAASKSEAANRASLITLQWLQSLGKINQKGEVELMVQINKQAVKIAPVAEIQLGADSVQCIEQIVNRYYENVLKNEPVKKLDLNTTESRTFSDSDDEGDLDIDTLPIQRGKKLFPHVADRRDQDLFRRFERVKDRRDQLSSALPIDKFKEEIVELVNNNSVVVIKGEPGCGKSTQVPQYVMEWFAAQKAATDCNIVVTQPRRISAISLAERVAYERDEQVGDVVGYHVRLYAKHPRYNDGYILYCSTGMLVRKMIGDSGLSGVTHIIVDEAHERDTQVDFLLLLLKRALKLNPSLKVIIMSATINAQLFSQFFDNCPSISIPGFTYPVQHHFLNNELQAMLERRGANFEEEDTANPTVNIEAVLGIITWIDQNKPDGAILVFMPGWMEIRTVMERISELRNADHFMVVPAHSKLSNEDQKRIFEKPVNGRRKLILATNIAETSLTINDVVYVVDSGAVKEERVDLKSGLVCLDNQWVSQANVRQRRGRAGRVQPGESYHLFTEQKFKSLDEFPIPEINRIPLTRSVLDVKMYTKDENISQFLSCLPEPPRQESVTQAVRVLQAMGALDDDENLTALGKRIYKFPLDPYLSKALVHACLFKCVSSVLTISTLLSADYTIFENTLGLKSRIRQLKQQYSPASDHVATARLYHEWESLDWADPLEAKIDCQHKGIVYKSMERTKKLRGLHAEHLNAAKLIPEGENINEMLTPCNKFSPYDEFVKSILLSGLGKILISHKPARKRGIFIRTSDGTPAVISSESVNSKFKELPSSFLTYFKSLSSTERRAVIVHESSLLSPVSVALFLPGVVMLKNMAGLGPEKSLISIEGPKPINIVINQKEGEQLLHLRQVIWNVMEYLIENEGEPKDVEQYKIISQYRDELLPILANLTSEQGANIDYTESGELRTEPSFDRLQSG